MAIKCCQLCADDRHPGCHGTCKQYATEKAIEARKKAYIRQFKEMDRFAFEVFTNGAGKRWKAVRA